MAKQQQKHVQYCPIISRLTFFTCTNTSEGEPSTAAHDIVMSLQIHQQQNHLRATKLKSVANLYCSDLTTPILICRELFHLYSSMSSQKPSRTKCDSLDKIRPSLARHPYKASDLHLSNSPAEPCLDHSFTLRR
jgi:hypothetical protein